jgi:dUTP pyrophosphatase
MKVKIVNKSHNPLPTYATAGSAGLDLTADVFEPVAIHPGGTVLIPSGVFIELPEGYEAQIRPRSGMVFKKGLTVPNSPGTIDSDFRGEVCVLLHNISQSFQYVNPGDRIAQLVVARYERIEWDEDTELSNTARMEGGFGSTGY